MKKSTWFLMFWLPTLWASGAAYGFDSASFNPVPIEVAAQASGGVPVGTVVAWPVASNPSDADAWLECNGQATTGYPDLAAVVGAKVPDLRGKFLRGLGGNSAALGSTQGDAIRNIKGQASATPARGYFVDNVNSSKYSGAFHPGSPSGGGRWSAQSGASWPLAFDASRVVPTANENRPVNMAVRYLIRARP